MNIFSGGSVPPSWTSSAGIGPNSQTPPGTQSVLNRPIATSTSPARNGSNTVDVLSNIHVDRRKAELLEARMYGNGPRFQPLNVQDNSNSLQSGGSEYSDEQVDHQPQPTPEKRTPTSERKRKRKVPDTHDGTSGHGKASRADGGGKKINEYFKHQQAHSPSRNFGPKSPSPSGLAMMPQSPVGPVPNYMNINIQSPPNFTDYISPQPTVSSRNSPAVQIMTRACQTDIVKEGLESMEKKLESVDELNMKIDEMKRQLLAQQKLSQQKDTHQKDTLTKCIGHLKTLLVEKSKLERETTRKTSIENQARLGQFKTQRQGASFVENWVDGYSFTRIIKEQQRIASEREEVDKERKLLAKRRPPSDAKMASKTAKLNQNSNSNDGFLKPITEKPNSEKYLSADEFYEEDDIIKLRLASLKKEDADLQIELEKLERERNLHIRELKRITQEDNSSFKNHPTLNDRYILLNLIGKGGFSEVHKAFDIKDQGYVACKIHQLKQDWREDKKNNYIKHAIREYNIHKQLQHQRIVKLHDVFEIDNNSFCTVLEYCEGNDLDFYLKQNKLIPEKEARSIMVQTVRALKYLNEIKPPVIHYDLKPGNLLLGRGSVSGPIKITDFGLSKIVEMENDDRDIDLTSQGAGTYWYLPPECFVVGKHPPRISNKVDVWSVGVIFYQCLYGKKPFGHNLSQAAILEENTILKAREVQFPPKPPVSNEAKNFIRGCLQYNKDLRPDVLQLANHEYLKPKSSRKESTTT